MALRENGADDDETMRKSELCCFWDCKFEVLGTCSSMVLFFFLGGWFIGILKYILAEQFFKTFYSPQRNNKNPLDKI